MTSKFIKSLVDFHALLNKETEQKTTFITPFCRQAVKEIGNNEQKYIP